MNKKTLLTAAVSVITAIGLSFAAVPFLRSLSMNAKQENEAWGACDVSDLLPGGLKKCAWAMVYRRTALDKSSIERFGYLLADPASKESEQPESARNEWRSDSKEFFIFKPWAPVRACGVSLKSPTQSHAWKPPEKEAINSLPYFTEPCEGRTWDTSGRLYQRIGYPPEKNLIVPKVRWVTESKVLIYGG